MNETPEDFARHNARMKRVQAARARIQARHTLERGLLIVHTGNGKGKSSSAFGMALRSLGWGMKVGIVQYVKGSWETGEKNFFHANPDLLTFEVMGEGFTWDTQDRARDITAARAAWPSPNPARPKADAAALAAVAHPRASTGRRPSPTAAHAAAPICTGTPAACAQANYG